MLSVIRAGNVTFASVVQNVANIPSVIISFFMYFQLLLRYFYN